jgi:glycine cleavage system H protein
VKRTRAAVHRQPNDTTGETVSEIPNDLRYSEDHLWVRLDRDSGLARIGVTDFAQQSLGDLIAVTLPSPGQSVQTGQACGDLESVKSLSDLICPITATVRARNDGLATAPELVNTDPYGTGWMLEVEADGVRLDDQVAQLLDAQTYRVLVGG